MSKYKRRPKMAYRDLPPEALAMLMALRLKVDYECVFQVLCDVGFIVEDNKGRVRFA